jgi:excisionase family DNA binding protein
MLDNYPDVLTVDDVRQILGLGKNAAYRAIQAGEIPSFKVGPRLIRISKEKLREAINAGLNTPAHAG